MEIESRRQNIGGLTVSPQTYIWNIQCNKPIALKFYNSQNLTYFLSFAATFYSFYLIVFRRSSDCQIGSKFKARALPMEPEKEEQTDLPRLRLGACSDTTVSDTKVEFCNE